MFWVLIIGLDLLALVAAFVWGLPAAISLFEQIKVMVIEIWGGGVTRLDLGAKLNIRLVLRQ